MNPEHLFIPQSEKTIKDFWDHVKMNSGNNVKKLSLLKDGKEHHYRSYVQWAGHSVLIRLHSECSSKNINPRVMLEEAEEHSF